MHQMMMTVRTLNTGQHYDERARKSTRPRRVRAGRWLRPGAWGLASLGHFVVHECAPLDLVEASPYAVRFAGGQREVETWRHDWAVGTDVFRSEFSLGAI